MTTNGAANGVTFDVAHEAQKETKVDSAHSQPKDLAQIIQLAQLFSTCVECFGLIHPSKEWVRAQLLVLCQLGIQQARLLAWGDNVGICETGANRDARLDDPEYRPKIEAALKAIIDRPIHVHRTTQFEEYGLKPPKRNPIRYQPALDDTRLEVFREKFEVLNHERWEVRRGMSVTAHHWQVFDLDKFKNFIRLVRENVDSLIELMGNEESVNRAVRHDIRALGWHPIFEKLKASSDSTKLRLIRDACKTDYPEYAAVTEAALAYIAREWKDNDEERLTQRSSLLENAEIPGVADRAKHQPAKAAKSPTERRASLISRGEEGGGEGKERRPSIFNMFRRSWRKSSKDLSAGASDQPVERERSKSADGAAPASAYTPTKQGPRLTVEEEPVRSKSIGHVPMRPPPDEKKSEEQPATQPTTQATAPTGPDKDHENAEKEDGADLTKVPTATATEGDILTPVTSMISRHDHLSAV